MTSKWKYKLVITKNKDEKTEIIEEIEKDRLPSLIKEISKASIQKRYIKASTLINFFMKNHIIPRKDFLFLTLNPDDPDDEE